MRKASSLEVAILACMILIPTYLASTFPRVSAENGSANVYIMALNDVPCGEYTDNQQQQLSNDARDQCKSGAITALTFHASARGVVVNLTNTYFIQNDPLYSMPMILDPYSVQVKSADMNNMLNMPYPSLTFFNQTNVSPISTEWRVVLDLSVGAAAIIGSEIFQAGWIMDLFAGNAGTKWANINTDELAQGQQLNWTQESAPSNGTYRNFVMNMFGTNNGLAGLPSLCSAFMFRIDPMSGKDCGLISMDLKGNVYVPFLYQPGQGGSSGDWVPFPVEIQIAFPMFLQ